MKVLVTGATGFLGAHLVERLGRDHDVVKLVRSAADDGVRGDVLDPQSLAPAMDGIDAVVHAAGAVSHKPADAARMYDVHVRGTENVLAAMTEAGVSRLVYIGSSGAVAVSATPGAVADESSPEPLDVIARWPYYRAKLFAEQAVLASDLDAVVLSPSLLLGPGDRRGGATRAVRYLLDGELAAAPPGGICFVDARDVAEAAASALDGDARGRFLLGAANWSFAEFYERLARVAELPAPGVRLPRVTRRLLNLMPKLDPSRLELGRVSLGAASREDLEFGCHWWWLDPARAARELGWRPRDPTATLADTVHDLRAHA